MACRVLLLCGLLLPANCLWAQDVTLPQEYGKVIKSAEAVTPLGDGLFGDETNLFTGTTEFLATDVRLTGNNALPVAVGRRYSVEDKTGVLGGVGIEIPVRPFGDWDLDIPYLRGVFARQYGWGSSLTPGTQRCSVPDAESAAPPYAVGGQGGTFSASEYWSGNNLHVPGQGSQEMLVVTSQNPNKPSQGGPFYWVTQGQWYFSCLSTTATGNGVAGEGFLAIAPDGTKYWFNWIVSRPYPQITKALGMPPLDPPSAIPRKMAHISPKAYASVFLRRVEVTIYPTKIEDRFGNVATFTYDNDEKQRLLSIASSDGRSIVLNYDANGHVETVVAGTRTWTYTYSSEVLTKVTLPDTSKWTYTLGALANVHAVQENYLDPDFTCKRPPSQAVQSTYAGSITHPSGAVGTFTFKPTLHGRSYVDRSCLWISADFDVYGFAYNPILYDAISIVEKRIDGPGLASPVIWTTNYGPTNHSFSADCGVGTCASTKQVEVRGPDSQWTRYIFSNRFRQLEGKLLTTEVGTKTGVGPTVVLLKETATYNLNPAGQPYPSRIGVSPYARGDRAAEKFDPLVQKDIIQQGKIFRWKVNTFDIFARPVSATRSSSPEP